MKIGDTIQVLRKEGIPADLQGAIGEIERILSWGDNVSRFRVVLYNCVVKRGWFFASEIKMIKEEQEGEEKDAEKVLVEMS